MRKTLSFITILFVLSGLAFGGIINVSFPQAGSWCTGSVVNIVWHETPKDHQEVKIRLFNGNATVKILDIDNNTPNDGNYDWTIPIGTAPGQYTMLVKTLDDQESDFSAAFTITNCTQPGSISVATPAYVNLGDNCLINWTSTGTVGSAVRVILFNQAGTTLVQNIVNNTNNDGNYSWPVPAGFQAGTYRIKIENLDGTVSGMSGTFNIGTILITMRPEERQAYFIPTPDLKISIIPVTSQPAEANKATLMEFKVDNIGIGTSKETTLRVFMGSKQTDTWVIKPIEQGRFRYKTKKYTPTGPGYIMWSADVDHANNIGDSNRTNNYKKYKMIVKGPDLIVCISNAKRPPVGGKRTITAVVKNIGEVKSLPCKLRIYVKQKGVTYHNIPALDPGNAGFRVTRKHAWGLSGTKKIEAIIDYYKVVPESNEKNNIATGSYFVRLPHHDTYAAGYSIICSDGTTPNEF